MRQAGFRYVFLGIENVLEADLTFLRARVKNTGRGDSGGRPAPRSRRSTTFAGTRCTWSAD
jgi:hypothetical protein